MHTETGSEYIKKNGGGGESAKVIISIYVFFFAGLYLSVRFNAHLIGSCILNSATLHCSLNSGFNSDAVTVA